jgi:hypothetical protein
MHKKFCTKISCKVGHWDIRRRWEDIIKMGLVEIGCVSGDLVKKIMLSLSRTAKQLLSVQGRPCTMHIVYERIQIV